MYFKSLLMLILLVMGGCSSQADSESPYGFIPVPMDRRAPHDVVLIISAMNCPSAGTQRARVLTEELKARGIPHEWRNEYGIAPGPIDDELAAGLKRLERVMKGKTPAVFINHMGRANPKLEQVVAEFERQTFR
jgi:hypothetical protein